MFLFASLTAFFLTKKSGNPVKKDFRSLRFKMGLNQRPPD